METVKCIVESLARTRAAEEKFEGRNAQGSQKCLIDEECDMYGFSLVHSASSKSTRGGVLGCFRDDANWNNPGSVLLMQRAFGIHDEYSCNIVQRHTDASYLDLRTEHNKMIALRLCQEGKALRDRGSFPDSCKRFDSALRFDPGCASAYEGRADVRIQLGKREEALQDYEEACRLQPENDSARAVAQLLRASIRVCAPSRFIPAAGSSASTSTAATAAAASTTYAGSSSATATATPTALSRLSLIGKLQQSLSRDEIARALDTSSSSSSASSSDNDGGGGEEDDDSNSTQSGRSSSGGGSKKKRKHSSDKRDRKSNKKRKSKHKSKREERKKKKRKH